METVYAIEEVCGGSNASGGGCGAPRGVRKVSQTQFESQKGKIFSDLIEHNDNEVAASIIEARDNSKLSLKLVFSACSSCYSRF